MVRGLEHEQVGVVGDLVCCAGIRTGVPAAGHPRPTVRLLIKENMLQSQSLRFIYENVSGEVRAKNRYISVIKGTAPPCVFQTFAHPVGIYIL